MQPILFLFFRKVYQTIQQFQIAYYFIDQSSSYFFIIFPPKNTLTHHFIIINHNKSQTHSPLMKTQPQQSLQQPSQWHKDIQSLFKHQPIQQHLLQQINEILPQTLSVIVIYQKLFIKFKSNSGHDQTNLYVLKIGKSFPLENSVRLYLLQGNYQPKLFDTRDIVHEVIGKSWTYSVSLKQILEDIPAFENKMSKRNQNYLQMQKTGDLLLGDLFVYNQLEQHSSLSLFPDKTQPQINLLNAVSETHLMVFQRVVKKSYKSKQEEEYELKSKTLYGKKFMLSKFCELQCINSMQVSSGNREVLLGVVKYRSLRTVDVFDSTTKSLVFGDDQSMRQFIRIVLKNLPKYQSTKISFLPSYEKPVSESKEEISAQRILELNQLEQRLQSRSSSKGSLDSSKQEELINRLNKSYQKMIEYYSARANPYYLIYVNKLNFLYQNHFVDQKGKEANEKGQHERLGVSDDKDTSASNQGKMANSITKNL